jgi:putative ABC transport system permease protein
MVKLSILSVWYRRRRLASIALAVMLGVSFLTGTIVLGDTLKANFDRLFTDVSAGTSVVVRNATGLDSPKNGADRDRGLVNESLVARVRGVPGVAAAEGQILGYGSLTGRDGSAIGGNGPPRQAGSWITDRALNPYRLVEGRAPVAPDEVVVNRGAAKAGSLHVGDVTTIQTPVPVKVHIVGLATFGNADGLGQTTFTGFTLAGAQANVIRQPGGVSSVVVRAESGVSSDTLRDRIRSVLPPGVEAITGHQLAQERINNISSTFLDLLRTFLVVFAGIALVVAALSINNAFSITVAQRTRELALLRAVGASRRQVRATVTLEALTIGVVAAAFGVLAGLGVAGLLKGMFDAFGFALPAGGLAVHTSSLLIGAGAGVLATLVAAQMPARRASSVAPISALRESEAEPRSVTRRRILTGGALAVGGGAVAVAAAATGSVILAAPGALALVAGGLVLAPVAVAPSAWVVGAVLRRIRPVAGKFAEENARRNPRRTAATATALVVGVAVVSMFTLFTASLKSTVNGQVNRGVTTDLVVSSPSFGGGQLSPQVVDELRRSPVVERAVGLGGGPVKIGAESTTVSATDTAQLRDVMRFDTTAGSFTNVGADGIAVAKAAATRHHWRIGTPVTFTFPGGNTVNTTVRAIYDNADLLDDITMPAALYERNTVQATDTVVFVKTRSGVTLETARRTLTPLARANGGSVQDIPQYAASTTSALNTLLGIVYVMLALAVLIALLGIANTLALAVYERRRELGLLRAVGQTRRQVRSMLRLESVVISTFGTVLGLLMGGFLGWVLAVTAGSTSFSFPVVQLATIAVLGGIAGVLAAIRPARRAARLPILDAIAAP